MSAASSAVTMATNNVVAQTGENFSGMNQVNWGSVGTSAVLGLGTGLVSFMAGYGACQFAGKFVMGGMSILSPAVKGIITGAIGGAGGGYASGFAMGMMTTGDLEAARDAGFHGMWKGALLGAGSGLAGSIVWARQNGVNPWSGKNVYPENDGFIGTPNKTTLQPGELVDRYGGTSPYSKFLAPEGTTISERSLHPSTDLSIYDCYKVVKPVQVESGLIQPFYGENGYGIQYKTEIPIQDLVEKGYLIKVK